MRYPKRQLAWRCYKWENDFNSQLFIVWFDCFFRIQAFEQKKTDMQQLHNIQENVITLNVGGQLYSTSKSALCSQKESMLAAMFSGYHQLKKMENGSYFIDADGKHFGTILNYLRGRIVYSTDLIKDRKTLTELKKEADFYNLVHLRDLVDICLKRFG